jgi:hypothetical protein
LKENLDLATELDAQLRRELGLVRVPSAEAEPIK